ncbi:MAG: hypothetical protein V1709_05895 [Planctomycetota bacterium]
MRTREKCKEYLCRDYVPQGKSLESMTCRVLHLCKYCYRSKFPKRKMWNLPEARHGSEKVLTPSDRRHIERSQFEYMEIFLWDPEFYYEWLDAIYD